MPLMTAEVVRKDYIPGIKTTADDERLTRLITIADQVLANYCRWPLPTGATEHTLASASYVLYLDGPGGDELHLPMAYVAAITSIYDDPERDYDSTTLVDSGDYTLYPEEGLVLLHTDSVHGAWSDRVRRALKVTCTAGWAATAVPDYVRHAVGMLVAHWYRRSIPEVGAKPEDVRDVDAKKADLPIPPEVRAAIAPARRLQGIAA